MSQRHVLTSWEGYRPSQQSLSDQRGAEASKFSPGKQNGLINRDRVHVASLSCEWNGERRRMVTSKFQISTRNYDS